MIKGGLTERYAKALYDLGVEKQQVKEYGQQLHLFVDELEQNADFKTIFCGKLVPASTKRQLIEQVFGALATDVKNFIFVVMDKNRERSLPEIMSAYDVLCDRAEGIQQVMVYTAVPLGEAEAEALKTSFEKKLNCKVRLKTAVDKSLIGGLKVQIDDTVFDASLAHQLNALKQTLAVE